MVTQPSGISATPHHFVSSLKLLTVFSVPTTVALMKMLPIGYTTSDWPPAWLPVTDQNILGTAVQPVFNWLHSLLIFVMLLCQLVDDVVLQDNVKKLIKVVVTSTALPLTSKQATSLKKGIRLIKHDFHLHKSMLITSDHPLILHVFGNSFQEDLLQVLEY